MAAPCIWESTSPDPDAVPTPAGFLVVGRHPAGHALWSRQHLLSKATYERFETREIRISFMHQTRASNIPVVYDVTPCGWTIGTCNFVKSRFLRNFCSHSYNDVASHDGGPKFSAAPLWEPQIAQVYKAHSIALHICCLSATFTVEKVSFLSPYSPYVEGLWQKSATGRDIYVYIHTHTHIYIYIYIYIYIRTYIHTCTNRLMRLLALPIACFQFRDSGIMYYWQDRFTELRNTCSSRDGEPPLGSRATPLKHPNHNNQTKPVSITATLSTSLSLSRLLPQGERECVDTRTCVRHRT
jgi:hypothetical protein